jgi:hypothetical protein
LQHSNGGHDTSLSRIASNIANSGLAETTSHCPLANAMRTAASE